MIVIDAGAVAMLMTLMAAYQVGRLMARITQVHGLDEWVICQVGQLRNWVRREPEIHLSERQKEVVLEMARNAARWGVTREQILREVQSAGELSRKAGI